MKFLYGISVRIILLLLTLLIPAVSYGLTVTNFNDDFNSGSLRHAVANASEVGAVNKKFHVPVTSESKAFIQPVSLADRAVEERQKYILLYD